MRHTYYFALLAALSLSATTVAFAAPVVVNGGFESGFVAPGNPIPGWTLTGNTNFVGVDNTATPGNAYGTGTGFAPHSGTWDADLGNVSTTATLSQTVADTAGVTATLTFWLNSEITPFSVTNSFSYSIDHNALYTVNLTNIAERGTYLQYTLTFLATGSDTIYFTFQNDNAAFALDDVSIAQASPAAAPEPSSLMLFGTGILAAAGAARRKLFKV